MRVAHVIQPGALAGAERVTLGGCAALAEAGAEVTLFILCERRAQNQQRPFVEAAHALDDVTVVELDVRARLDREAVSRLAKELAEHRIQVVHAHGAKALFYASAASPRRLVCTLHGDTGGTLANGAYERLQRSMARRCDMTFTVTPQPLSGARRSLYSPNFLTRSLPLTITHSYQRDEALELAFIGRISHEKGLDVLIDAVRQCHTRVRLTVAGDGPERAELERNLGPNVDVRFLGFVDDVADVLANAHALVLPSRTEGMPLTLIEARCAGLPVISTDVGAVRELIDHGVDGLVVEPENTGALARAIDRLARDHGSIADAARGRAISERLRRDPSVWAERTLGAYHEIAGGEATWIVFGDDWGAHPSTTQHLARSLPEGDRIVWIDSIGMRAPTMADASRVIDKAKSALTQKHDSKGAGSSHTGRGPDAVISPRILPWHDRFASVNKVMLRTQIESALREIGADGTRILLASNPVAQMYADIIDHDRLVYLKLDDYARLPGVDPELAERHDSAMCERADLVVATSRALLPPIAQATHMPQGVDCEHFGARRHRPGKERIVGFFGLFAEWLDDDLIASAARARPDWVFEFVGPSRREIPQELKSLPNIRFCDAVPYSELPERIESWSAAWIPFERSELTDGVDPLKLREYLAAGLPTCCTSIPEVVRRSEALGVTLADEASAVSDWLDSLEQRESERSRQARRDAMRNESWSARASRLRDLALAKEA